MPVDLAQLLSGQRAQPQTAPALRRDGFAGRAACWLPLHPDWGMRDLVSGRGPTARPGTVPAPRWAANRLTGAVHQRFDGGNALDFDELPFLAKWALGTPITITWLEVSGVHTAAFPRVLNFAQPDDLTSSFGIWHGAAGGTYQLQVGRHGSMVQFPLGGLVDGQVDRFVVQCLAGAGNSTPANFVLWRNGVRYGSASTSPATSSVPLSTGQARIGARRDNAQQPWVGALGDIGVIWGIVPERDILDYMADPYGVAYAPGRRTVFFNASSGFVGPLDQAAETSLAQPIGAVLAFSLAQAAETSIAQPIGTGGTSVSLEQATESNLAQPIGTVQARALVQVIETNIAQPIGATQSRVVGQAGEADAAQPIGALQTRGLSQVIETDAAQSITLAEPNVIGQAVEADLAQPISVRQALTLGQVVEAGSAQPITVLRTLSVGLALEIDVSQPIAARQVATLGQVVEAGSAMAIAPVTPGTGGGASAAEVWNYTLSNGLTAEANVVGIYAMLQTLSGQAPCPTADQIATAVWAKELPL